MCILLELDYAKVVVSNLFGPKIIEEKPLGGSALEKEGLNVQTTQAVTLSVFQSLR